MTLRGAGTFGELDVRALLIPGLDRVGTGWGRPHRALHGPADGAVAVALDRDTELDESQWAQAVAVYVNEALAAATPWTLAVLALPRHELLEDASRVIVFDRSGRRTALVIGGDRAATEMLARVISGRG